MESSLEEAACRSEGRTGSEQRNRVGPEVSSSGAQAQGWGAGAGHLGPLLTQICMLWLVSMSQDT